MKRAISKLTTIMSCATALVAVSLPSLADDLTVVSFGGAYGAAQKKSMIDTYVAAKGTNILFEDYSGGVAEMTAQVESGNIQWDVVDIEAVDLERACSEGLLEVIPRDILPREMTGRRPRTMSSRHHSPTNAASASCSGR